MSDYIEMLIRCKRERKEALAFWESFPNPIYKMIANQYGCSISYAREMIYKAKKERQNGSKTHCN